MKRRRIILASVALATTSLFVVFCCLVGRSGRIYFSPDTLDTKSQSEILLPFTTDVSIYRSQFEYYRWPLAEYLVQKGYWSPRTAKEPTWLLTYHWSDQWKDGNTDLERNLAWKRQFWMEWSDEHPELAKVVWPWVLKALRTDNVDREDFVSLLLWNVRRSNSVEEFQSLVSNDPDRDKIEYIPPPDVEALTQ